MFFVTINKLKSKTFIIAKSLIAIKLSAKKSFPSKVAFINQAGKLYIQVSQTNR